MQTFPTSDKQSQLHDADVDSRDFCISVDTSSWADYAREYEENLNGRLARLGLIGLAPIGLIILALI